MNFSSSSTFCIFAVGKNKKLKNWNYEKDWIC